MTRLEGVILLTGMTLIVVAALAIDWRLGALVAGVALIVAVVDLPAVRR